METKPKWILTDEIVDVLNNPSQDFQDCTPQNEYSVTENNFEPRKILELLVQRTPHLNPADFLKDIKNLIYFRIFADNNSFDENDEWYKHLLLLEIQYNVCRFAAYAEHVTFNRVNLTFPQYALVHKQNLEVKCRGKKVNNHAKQFFLPEFGALIPNNKSKLRQDVRLNIIIIHLSYLANQKFLTPNRYGVEVGEYTNVLLLKKRIESGILSDERRIRFLINQNVIQMDGELSQETKAVLESIINRPQAFETRRKLWHLIE